MTRTAPFSSEADRRLRIRVRHRTWNHQQRADGLCVDCRQPMAQPPRYWRCFRCRVRACERLRMKRQIDKALRP